MHIFHLFQQIEERTLFLLRVCVCVLETHCTFKDTEETNTKEILHTEQKKLLRKIDKDYRQTICQSHKTRWEIKCTPLNKQIAVGLACDKLNYIS